MVALNKKCVGVERSTSPEGESIQVGKSTGTLQRHLNNHQIQLIAAGGSIGTALFISISRGLAKGGPGSLLIAYTIYSCILTFINNSITKINTYMPVPGGFIYLAGY
jgi:amino acid transporter